jgi:hypothetical protein
LNKKVSNSSQIGEHEVKFILDNSRSRTLTEYVSKVCRPDPLYPEGIVSSIYFDTRDFLFLGEKLSSDFLKAKVRFRWYSSVNTGESFPNLFLEVKRKIGSAREKYRKNIDMSSSWVQKRSLHCPDYHIVNEMLLRHGQRFNQNVYPILQINYRRSRFIDSLSGARLSVDRDINVSRTNRNMVRGCKRTLLKTAVFEFKSSSHVLPDWLGNVIAIGDCKKDAFSKYSECYAHLLN